MDYSYLKISEPGLGVRLLTISAPETLNALNSGILKELNSFLDNIDDSTRVLLIRGDGDKSFIAGADISEMKDLSKEEAYEFSRLGSHVFKRIEDLEIPVIAVVNGFALGGGCELAMSCDIRLASEKAKFGQPEVGLGIIPGFSGTHRMTKLIGPAFAKELIYTGKMINAEEALRIGLVNAVYAPDKLMEEAINFALRIKCNGKTALAYAKRCINENYNISVGEAIALENKYFSLCFQTCDQMEGMSAFLEKRKPEFK